MNNQKNTKRGPQNNKERGGGQGVDVTELKWAGEEEQISVKSIKTHHGIILNQICIKEGLFPKYTHIYIYMMLLWMLRGAVRCGYAEYAVTDVVS